MNLYSQCAKFIFECLLAHVLISAVFPAGAESLIVQLTSEKIFSQKAEEIEPPLKLQVDGSERTIEVSQSTPPDIEVFSVRISSPNQADSLMSFGYCSATKLKEVVSIEREGVDLGHRVRHGHSGISDQLHYVCHRIGDSEALTLLISLDPSMRILATWRSSVLQTPLATNNVRLKRVGNNQYAWVKPD